MKKVVSLAVILVMLAALGAVAEDMKGDMASVKWFDPPNCEFCKNMIENPKLMENMTYEYHDISNGCVSISTVKPEFQADYKKAMEAMMALGQDMESGKRNPAEVKMDGSCQAYGMLMMAGAKAEYVQSDNADVMVMTSTDEAVVKQIHDYAERNRMELAKWHDEHMTMKEK